MQSTGNINYSLNKNDFYKVLTSTFMIFVPFYYIIVCLSLIYIYTIRYSHYYNGNKKSSNRINTNIEHYFKSITYHSPYDIMSLNYKNINANGYMGLSSISYILIIISYIITLLIILQGAIRNFMYSVYLSIIQVNPHNNPYNNPNNISKINEIPSKSIISNYFIIISLSLVFLIPFGIPLLIKLLKFDNYNIKHNVWFSYLLILLIFSPFIIVLICYSYFNKSLSIFGNLNKFIQTNDYSFVDYISNNFNLKIYSILPYLFIIFILCYYRFVYVQINYKTLNDKIIEYVKLFFTIFIFVPVVILFFSFSLLFDNKITEGSDDIINNIKTNGISSLYDLLVKYNYPCFPK